MLANAGLYSQCHSPQEIDGNKLLDYTLLKMTFDDEDLIMDVGCGSGDNTMKVLLPRIPKMKKIIAVDIIPEMIEFARMNTTNEKIEYHVADIEEKSSLKPWEGSISKIFSVYVFNWAKNQRQAFESVYSLLKPKGDAALTFIISTRAWDTYPSLVNNVKWNKYLKDAEQCIPESHLKNLGAEDFRKLFEDLGFEVLLCKKEESSHSFKNDADAKAAWAQRSALTSYIPEELRDEFGDDLFKTYMQFYPRNPDGLPTVYLTLLLAHLRKP